jgi:aminopeptidase
MLVEDAVEAKPGWQVLVYGDPLAMPLLREVSRVLAEIGAHALLRYQANYTWLAAAPQKMLDRLSEIETHELETADARVSIEAPSNKRDSSVLSPERRARWIMSRRHPTREYGLSKRIIICQYPTEALAQEAGLTLDEFADVLYDAVLVDYGAMRSELAQIKERFDGAKEIRIVGAGTDLRLSLAGRAGAIDAGDANIPAGEVYFSPLEDSAEGVIEFSEFPAVYSGREVSGARLRFDAGRVVEASASSNEEFLLSTLDADEGARVIGELGVGGNPGIQRHMKNTLFDEKIAGTIHLALGQSYEETGGTNTSGIHWDIVKDLRPGGELIVDGETVQRDGRWIF